MINITFDFNDVVSSFTVTSIMHAGVIMGDLVIEKTIII